MDSGASFHASPYKDSMKNFIIGNFGKVRLIDDEALNIVGMGDINLRTFAGTVWTLKDIRYIPVLKRMLISVELKEVEVGFCEPCVFGKQKRVTFAKSWRMPKVEKLELVHTDVYGPTSVSSLGVSRYYVTFIDDSTRKVWVYFLKQKSEVFNTFKK
uniref:Retrovirus-related Pol polyprotein from transposon TNT 1-94 n=1 Tax=Cajanus cajan TaxID=3821 RepID=A0A151SI67_CAJCA|nr:Retrovirus-related Pol polyprotein from transposon TNT 1-94 [Cajanus cajan]